MVAIPRGSKRPSCHECSRVTLFIFTFVILVISIFAISLGVYGLIKTESDTTPEKKTLGSRSGMFDVIKTARGACITLLVVGSIGVIIGFVGFIGVIRESTCLLLIFFFLTIVVLLIYIAVSIVLFVYRGEALKNTIAKVLESDMQNYLPVDPNNKTEQYKTNEYGLTHPHAWKDNRVFLKFLEKNLECCGSDGVLSYNPHPWPESCTLGLTETEAAKRIGCTEALYATLRKYAYVIAVSIILCGLIILFGILVTAYLIYAINWERVQRRKNRRYEH